MLNKCDILIVFAATAVAVAALPAVAQDGGRKLSATLTGAAEVPRLGDPDGSGTAELRINPGQKQICYTLAVKNIDPARAAHIHEAPVGTAGPIVVMLQAPTGGGSQACATVTRELALEILKSPEHYYVNVHNAAYPAGALRGQLRK